LRVLPCRDAAGRQGPGADPESLGRLKGDKLAAVIADGRTMTQMPAFKDTLSPRRHCRRGRVTSAPIPTPVWAEAEIAESRA
jgi:hypothetical protein